jgi:hypothetical protein
MSQQVQGCLACEGMIAMSFLIKPHGKQWVDY